MDPTLQSLLVPQQPPVAQVTLPPTAMQTQAPATPAAVPAQFGPMLNPTPDGFDISQINKPATSPQEVEQRKVGWQTLVDKFTSDPNAMRALFMMGASMAQPIQPGQSTLGHMAKAGVMGLSAFEAGKANDLTQQRLTQESQARVAASQAATEASQQQTAQAKAMQDSKVAQAKTDAEAAAQRLANAKSEEEVAQIERQVRERRARLEQEIPDETIRKDVRASFDKALATAEEARARARKEKAQASVAEMTREVFDGLSQEEKVAFVTKSGKYSTNSSTSSFAQQRDTWGNLYDKLPVDSPLKKGLTREEFVIQRLSSNKVADAAKQLNDYIKATDAGDLTPDPEIISALTDAIKLQAQGRGGRKPGTDVTSTEPKAGPGSKGSPIKVTNVQEYNSIQSGHWYTDPNGILRQKK